MGEDMEERIIRRGNEKSEVKTKLHVGLDAVIILRFADRAEFFPCFKFLLSRNVVLFDFSPEFFLIRVQKTVCTDLNRLPADFFRGNKSDISDWEDPANCISGRYTALRVCENCFMNAGIIDINGAGR